MLSPIPGASRPHHASPAIRFAGSAAAFRPPAGLSDQLTLRFAGKTQPVNCEARSTAFTVTMPSGRDVRLRKWTPSPEASPRRPQTGSPVLMVHGASSRSAWMSPLAWTLADKKPQVYGIDINNVSYADNNVGDFKSYTELVDEVRETVEWLYREHGEPVFLVAHSMGALISTLIAGNPPMTEDGKPMLKGVVLMAPAYDYAPGTYPAGFHLKYLKRLAAEKLGLKAKPLGIPSTQAINSVTSSPERKRLMVEAKDRVHTFTPTSWREMRRMMDAGGKAAKNVDVSTLMIIPAHDGIADPMKMERYFRLFSARDKQMVVYGNTKHDLVWEPVLDEMAQVINRWMTARSVSFRKEAE